jgi:hypothetical protein
MSKFIIISLVIAVIILVIFLVITFLPSCSFIKNIKMKKEIRRSMDEFNNRNKYKQITKEMIHQIPDNQLEQALIDFILDEKVRNDYENEYSIINSLPKGLIYLYATWHLEAEVNNGGFNQYYFNSAGMFSKEALEGCKYFGAIKLSKIVEESIAIYKKEKIKLDEAMEKGTIEAFSETYEDTEFNKLDDEFYNLDENLGELRIGYIRENSSEFLCK